MDDFASDRSLTRVGLEVTNLAKLASAYDLIKQAIVAGELDEAIVEASIRAREGFGKQSHACAINTSSMTAFAWVI